MKALIAIVILMLTPALARAWPPAANPPTATVMSLARKPLWLCFAANANTPVCGQDLTVKVGDVVSIGVSTSKDELDAPFPAQVLIITPGVPPTVAAVAANGWIYAIRIDAAKAWALRVIPEPARERGAVQFLPTSVQTVTAQ